MACRSIKSVHYTYFPLLSRRGPLIAQAKLFSDWCVLKSFLFGLVSPLHEEMSLNRKFNACGALLVVINRVIDARAYGITPHQLSITAVIIELTFRAVADLALLRSPTIPARILL